MRSKYNFRATVRVIPLSPEFSSDRAYRATTKNSTELVAGFMRTLGLATPARDFITYMRLMGQKLFNPPHAGSWPSGLAWIRFQVLCQQR